ncbi:MAG: hypothetical protein HY721_19415 [Planctomycetes bacterium]|nr:hypothetical protein [Planctomycetota bacterium]
MKTIRFTTTIGMDQVIRLPTDVRLSPGDAEVIVIQGHEPRPSHATSTKTLAERLSSLADELGVQDLPEDMAENHDHYAHGAPKGIDAYRLSS